MTDGLLDCHSQTAAPDAAQIAKLRECLYILYVCIHTHIYTNTFLKTHRLEVAYFGEFLPWMKINSSTRWSDLTAQRPKSHGMPSATSGQFAIRSVASGEKTLPRSSIRKTPSAQSKLHKYLYEINKTV